MSISWECSPPGPFAFRRDGRYVHESICANSMRKLEPVDKHLLRGAATTLILLVLRESPSYGYQIVQDIKARSAEAFDFPEGTIYPLLYGLEADGMIKGDWKPGTGERKRKVYRITAAGRGELERRISAWDRYAGGMRAALRSI